MDTMTEDERIEQWTTALRTEQAPRRFAIYETRYDNDGTLADLVLRAWGLVIDDDNTVAIGVDDGDGCSVNGWFRSAESALHFLGYAADTHLEWLDAPVVS